MNASPEEIHCVHVNCSMGNYQYVVRRNHNCMNSTDLFCFVFLHVFCRDLDAAARLARRTHHLGVQLELHALLGERALEGLGNLHVDAQPTHVTHELDHGDLRAQPLPHRALGWHLVKEACIYV